MKYATVCSGVEAMSLAVAGMGWEPVFFSEIEPFPCELLKQRFPGVPNLGDMTKIEGEKYNGTVDILAGGTPCQSFSVAGKRGGLEDGRGQLMLNFVRLAYETGAKYVVWENVPGCLSSNHGEDFAALLSSLCGHDVSVPDKGWKNSGVVTNADNCYGVAWRVLDAQFTRVSGFPRAVPQRRRRVWLVGYLGDWRRAAEILFVSESLPWNLEASVGTGEEVARGVKGGAGKASEGDLTYSPDVANCLQTTCDDYSRADGFNMVAEKQPIISCASKQQSQNIGHDVAMPIMANDYKEPQVVCYENHANDSRVTDSGDLSPTNPPITSRCGTGGGNLPLVKEARVYSFDAKASNSMKSSNPNSGCHETQVAKCIDTTYPCPSKNQGGNAVLEEAPIAISDVIHGDKACNGKGWNDDGSAYTLDTMATQGVCFQRSELRQRGSLTPLEVSPMLMAGCKEGDNELTVFSCKDNGRDATDNLAPTLRAMNGVKPNGGGQLAFATTSLVRRLTPTECERLMGFPVNWTKIAWRGKSPDDCPDAPRYKACGNSWAVNCARWVMMRIQQSEDKYNKKGNV